MTSDKNNDLKRHTYTKKISLNTASFSALYMLPLAAQAGIVNVTTPFALSITDANSVNYQPIDWDVDGNSVVDFKLEAFRSTHTSEFGSVHRRGNVFLNSEGFSGQGIIGKTIVEPTSFSSPPIDLAIATSSYGGPLRVGPDLNFNWNVNVKHVLARTFNGSQFGPVWADANGVDNPIIGFRFLGDTNQTLYGWAEINLRDLSNDLVTIEQWAYEDSGNSIAIGQTSVPLPSAFFSMLSGLALGAGSVLRGRRQRKAKAKQDASTETA